METIKAFRRGGTISMEFITLPDGTKVINTYDKKGTIVAEKQEMLPKISDEARELVKSAELLSKKRKKYHITSIWKERGE